MRIVVKLKHETRYIEHVQLVQVMPDEGAPENVYCDVSTDIEDDGSFVLVIKEET